MVKRWDMGFNCRRYVTLTTQFQEEKENGKETVFNKMLPEININ